MADDFNPVKSLKSGEEEEHKEPCPRCGTPTKPPFKKIDAGLRLRLSKDGVTDLEQEVCPNCFADLEKIVSKGAKLRAEAIAKEKNRHVLWKGRLNVVRQGRQLLKQKAYAEAAVSYEKYIKIIEIVCKIPHGSLRPEHLKGQESEMTVVASVLYDLLKIYDKSSTHQGRSLETASKLAEFARYSPMYAGLLRKAEADAKRARNPEAFKRFLKIARADRPRCFISTAAFNGQKTWTVLVLCEFRDKILRKSYMGRMFIYYYYQHSPKLAKRLDNHSQFKPILRWLLKRSAQALSKSFHLNP